MREPPVTTTEIDMTPRRRSVRGLRAAALLCGVAVIAGSTGCVRRVVSITSDPSGATVWLNDREIGRTPCSVDFTYYGTYDVRLELEGYEPMSTSADANAPWWDTIGVDVFAEATPANLKSTNTWHFTLQPAVRDHSALAERAREMRERTTPSLPPPEPAMDAAPTPPNEPPSDAKPAEPQGSTAPAPAPAPKA